MSDLEVRVELPESVVEEIAERAAAIVLERLGEQDRGASRYLTVREASELIRGRPQRIYDLLSAGRLNRHKDGARVLIRRDELEDYLAGEVALISPSAPQHRTANGVRT